MDSNWVPIAFFAVCLPILSLGKALGGNAMEGTQNELGKEDNFLSDHGHSELQSWKDWMSKRGFGDSTFGFGDENLQSWKDWVDKRGAFRSSGKPKFGGGLNTMAGFQSWMEKRGFDNNQHEYFKGTAPMDKGQLQMWADWMKKRGFENFGSGANTFGQDAAGNLQAWGDFSKKADFGGQPDLMGVGGMQPWHMYKRPFGAPAKPFSVPFGSNPNMMKWDDMIKRSAGGSLGNGHRSFGNYRQYFTNGLQDWRNMYQASKRTQSNAAKSTKQKDN